MQLHERVRICLFWLMEISQKLTGQGRCNNKSLEAWLMRINDTGGDRRSFYTMFMTRSTDWCNCSTDFTTGRAAEHLNSIILSVINLITKQHSLDLSYNKKFFLQFDY